MPANIPSKRIVRPISQPQKVMPKQPAPAARPVSQPSAKPVVTKAPLTQAASAAARFPGTARVNVTATTLTSINTSAAATEIASEANSLQSSVNDLQSRSSLRDIQSDVANLDTLLNRVDELLESARHEGYHFQSDLEGIVYGSASQWSSARPQVLSMIQQQAVTLQRRVATINPALQQVNMSLSNPTRGATAVRNAQTQVNSLLSDVSSVESDLRKYYAEIKTRTDSAETRLKNIHWAMDQLAEAKFKLGSGEELVLAVAARWDKEGKDDPEGVLFLSNKRLIFERKEKIATKKILFITTASELVQEVLIDQPFSGIRAVKPENKGLFGHQDFLMVEFSDRQLGTIALHINGQESKDWAAMIECCRSGQIESERSSGATGLNTGDLARQLTPADLLAIQSEANALQDDLMLMKSREAISNLENEVRGLERKLAGVRAHGYQVEKDLETEIVVLSTQWDHTKANAQITLENQARLLGEQSRAIQQKVAIVVGMSNNLTAARAPYMQIKSSMASAKAQAEAAKETVQAQFRRYAEEVESISAHLDWVDWMLNALATASFRLMATECGVGAVEAMFEHPNWEPENGILFITDQRLIWEDRVGDYELKVNVPLQDVFEATCEANAQGQETLVVKFGAQGPVPVGRFKLSLPVGDDWVRMIGRARSGDYSQDRTSAISEAELERIRNAPKQCTNCGAALTAPILRGQTEICCEYCGLVIRI